MGLRLWSESVRFLGVLVRKRCYFLIEFKGIFLVGWEARREVKDPALFLLR
jgi:hypothetical protein